MSGTFLSGPSIVAGPLLGEGSGLAPQEYSAEFGPSLSYQGDAIPDIRFAPINKDNPLPGMIPAHFNSPFFLEVDAIPAASSATTNNIASVAGTTSGTALALLGWSWGVSPNIPMLQVSTGNVVTPALMLDFGMAPITVAAGSNVATPGTVNNASTIGWYSLGQWIVIDQAVSTTAPLIAQVQGIGATTLTLSAPAARSGTWMAGSANLFSALNYGTATCHVPAVSAGLARLWDPQQSIARGLGVTGVASGTGGTFKVVGYDLYGNPQTENLVATAGATTAYGKKAWKGIVSITPQFTDAHAYTIGTSDVIGFTTRSDRYEASDLYWNGSYLTQATGGTGGAWVAADTTSPALSTTGDVRGTFQVSSRGQTAGVTAAATNGALSSTNLTGNRVAIYSSINLYNLIAATPQNPVPMYGVTPA